jgi:hypothetical protein
MTGPDDLAVNLFASAVWWVGGRLISRVRSDPNWSESLGVELSRRGAVLKDYELKNLKQFLEGLSVEQTVNLANECAPAILSTLVFEADRVSQYPPGVGLLEYSDVLTARAEHLSQVLVPSLLACHVPEAKLLALEIENAKARRDIEEILARLVDFEVEEGHQPHNFVLHHAHLRPPTRHSLSAHALLFPAFGVIPYRQPGGLMHDLLSWRDSDSPIEVGYLTGNAGVGKTRAGLEFSRMSSQNGWYSGFVDDLTDSTADVLCAESANRLVVIDYAETRREETRNLLSRLNASRPLRKTRVRLLLLCRAPAAQRGPASIFGYGQSVVDNLFLTGRQFDLLRYLPASFGEKAARRTFFESCLRKFFEVTGTPEKSTPTPDLSSDVYSTPLTIAMRAVLSMDWETADHPTRESLVDSLLSREAIRYWKGAPVGETTARRAIALLGFNFKRDRAQSAKFLMTSIDFAGDSPRSLEAVDFTHRVYGSATDCFAVGLRPDLLAERLVETEIDCETLERVCLQEDAIEAVATMFSRTISSNWKPGIRGILVSLVQKAAIQLARNDAGDKRRADALAELVSNLEFGPDSDRILSLSHPSQWTWTGRFFYAVELSHADWLGNAVGALPGAQSVALLNCSVRARHLGLIDAIPLAEKALSTLPKFASPQLRASIVSQLANSINRFHGSEMRDRVEHLLRQALELDSMYASVAKSPDARLGAAQSEGDLGSFLLDHDLTAALPHLSNAVDLADSLSSANPDRNDFAIEAERLRRNLINGTLALQKKTGSGFDTGGARKLLASDSLVRSDSRLVKDAELLLELGEPALALKMVDDLLARLDPASDLQLAAYWLEAFTIGLRSRVELGLDIESSRSPINVIRNLYSEGTGQYHDTVATTLVSLSILQEEDRVLSALHRSAGALPMVRHNRLESIQHFCLCVLLLSSQEFAVGALTTNQESQFAIASFAMATADDLLFSNLAEVFSDPLSVHRYALAKIYFAVFQLATLRTAAAAETYRLGLQSYSLARAIGADIDQETEETVTKVGQLIEILTSQQGAQARADSALP